MDATSTTPPSSASSPSSASARSRNPLAFLDAEIDELRAKGLFRRLRVVQSQQKSRCVIDGREVITLSSNNYLGLNTHPRLWRSESCGISKADAVVSRRKRAAFSEGDSSVRGR